MENLLEFMFGAGGRINRAEYWLSILKFTVAGLFAAGILATAAGIATPLLVIAIVLVLIPWLMWGLAIHTERLHDRSKSAWWLLAFYVTPGALGRLSSTMWSEPSLAIEGAGNSLLVRCAGCTLHFSERACL